MRSFRQFIQPNLVFSSDISRRSLLLKSLKCSLALNLKGLFDSKRASMLGLEVFSFIVHSLVVKEYLIFANENDVKLM